MSQNPRIGIFGGSFDPPHRAHAAAILWALQSGEIDRVLMIPAARHAFGKQHTASFEQRASMCHLAVAEFAPGLVEVSRIEGERTGVSYSIDTVEELARLHPEASFRLLVGTDILDDLGAWHRGGELLRLAPPLVIPRIVEHSAHPERGVRPGALPMLSSTTIRERAARSEDISLLVPSRVARFIADQGLYR
ncbi:MAG: nicotinate-nucleotide adenylyltransferase [Candidatus Sumerlaeota bacterium]|nr:nicotinate-nucleotide adenylyltransferase [Candidatus Sumerlaeota bacterium]